MKVWVVRLRNRSMPHSLQGSRVYLSGTLHQSHFQSSPCCEGRSQCSTYSTAGNVIKLMVCWLATGSVRR
jgi:hypothetical protein